MQPSRRACVAPNRHADDSVDDAHCVAHCATDTWGSREWILQQQQLSAGKSRAETHLITRGPRHGGIVRPSPSVSGHPIGCERLQLLQLRWTRGRVVVAVGSDALAWLCVLHNCFTCLEQGTHPDARVGAAPGIYRAASPAAAAHEGDAGSQPHGVRAAGVRAAAAAGQPQPQEQQPRSRLGGIHRRVATVLTAKNHRCTL
jgi:hypothetical protein